MVVNIFSIYWLVLLNQIIFIIDQSLRLHSPNQLGSSNSGRTFCIVLGKRCVLNFFVSFINVRLWTVGCLSCVTRPTPGSHFQSKSRGRARSQYVDTVTVLTPLNSHNGCSQKYWETLSFPEKDLTIWVNYPVDFVWVLWTNVQTRLQSPSLWSTTGWSPSRTLEPSSGDWKDGVKEYRLLSTVHL